MTWVHVLATIAVTFFISIVESSESLDQASNRSAILSNLTCNDSACNVSSYFGAWEANTTDTSSALTTTSSTTTTASTSTTASTTTSTVTIRATVVHSLNESNGSNSTLLTMPSTESPRDAPSEIRISGIAVIQGRRFTKEGCPCLKDWVLYGYANDPVTDYCGNPIGDPRGEWCFIIDPQCSKINWGYCAPIPGDCDVGKEWIVSIDGSNTGATVVGRQGNDITLRIDSGPHAGSQVLFRWSPTDHKPIKCGATAQKISGEAGSLMTTATTTAANLALAPSMYDLSYKYSKVNQTFPAFVGEGFRPTLMKLVDVPPDHEGPLSGVCRQAASSNVSAPFCQQNCIVDVAERSLYDWERRMYIIPELKGRAHRLHLICVTSLVDKYLPLTTSKKDGQSLSTDESLIWYPVAFQVVYQTFGFGSIFVSPDPPKVFEFFSLGVHGKNLPSAIPSQISSRLTLLPVGSGADSCHSASITGGFDAFTRDSKEHMFKNLALVTPGRVRPCFCFWFCHLPKPPKLQFQEIIVSHGIPTSNVETHWRSLAIFSTTLPQPDLWPDARVRYAEDETCGFLLPLQVVDSNVSNLTNEWNLHTTVIGNFSLCFCSSSCDSRSAFWEHVGSVTVKPNSAGEFVKVQATVGEPFDVTLEVQEFDDFNETGRMKIVWPRAGFRPTCREVASPYVTGTSCQGGERTGCSEGFEPFVSNSSIEGAVRSTWVGVVLTHEASSSGLLICYCDPRAWCDSVTGWLPVGTIHPGDGEDSEDPLTQDVVEPEYCTAGTYKFALHGPPLGLRLTYSMQMVMRPDMNFMETVREKVAESVHEPMKCVDVIKMWSGSVIVALGVAPHRCGMHKACEAHIIEGLHSSWQSALQSPNSPLRSHFGSNVDLLFPALLDDAGCAVIGLNCRNGRISEPDDRRRRISFPLEETAERSEEPEKSKDFWTIWWVTGVITFVCTSCAGYILIVVFRRARVRLRRIVHATEIKRDVEILANLGRCDVTLDELGERAHDGCSICLNPFEPPEELLLLPCDHLLHYECVLEWLQRRLTCPLCRCPMSLRECLIHVIQPSSGGNFQRWWTTPSTLANRVALYNPEQYSLDQCHPCSSETPTSPAAQGHGSDNTMEGLDEDILSDAVEHVLDVILEMPSSGRFQGAPGAPGSSEMSQEAREPVVDAIPDEEEMPALHDPDYLSARTSETAARRDADYVQL